MCVPYKLSHRNSIQPNTPVIRIMDHGEADLAQINTPGGAPMDPPPGGNAAPAKTIRVVDSKRRMVDMTQLEPEELQMALESIVRAFKPDEHQAIFSLVQLISNIRALRNHGPDGGAFLTTGPQGGGSFESAQSIMGEVALRQLLYSDAVRPVVTTASLRRGALSADRSRGKPPQAAGGTKYIRVRPGRRKEVYSLDLRPGRRGKYRGAAVAAEQPIEVVGLVIDPTRQGGLILDVIAGGVFPGVWPMIESGAFVASVLSVGLARADPSVGPQIYSTSTGPSPPRAEGPPVAVLPYSPDLVIDLRRQIGAALAYHLSGAGAVLALDAANQKTGRMKGDGVASIAEALIQVPSRGVDLPTRNLLEFFVGRIADVFPGVVASPDAFVFAITPLLDIFRVGAFNTYYHVLAEGREAQGARFFLERTMVARAENDQAAALERAIFAETAQARQYIIIIEDKFGAERVRSIFQALALLGSSSADIPEIVLGQLQKRDREIVALEYENRRHDWEAQSNNKCPHVHLARRLRSARSSTEAVDILKKLSAYFQTPPRRPGKSRAPLGWIHCKSCSFRAICPHVEELIQMEARNMPYDAVRTRLMKYAVQYSDIRGSETYYYFCRVCSERLAEFTTEDRTADVLGAVGGLDDHVRKVIWIEAIQASDLVRFPMPVNARKFAGTAVAVCHPLLINAEAALLKRGSRAAKKGRAGVDSSDPFGDEGSVDPRTHLYISLFVYAYILNLIRTSHETSKGGSLRIGFEGVPPGDKMSSYAKTILSTILKKYSGSIALIEDITPEFIADRFREAYRLVVGVAAPQEYTSADDARLIVDDIVTLSPAYYYIANAARVFGVLPIGGPSTPQSTQLEFETVLGRTLPAILKDLATETKSELVQMLLGVRTTKRTARRVAVEYPRGVDPLYAHSAPEVNFLFDMFRVPDKIAKGVDLAPLNRLKTLASSFPACGDLCLVEAVGGRADKRAVKQKDLDKRAVKQKDPDKRAVKKKNLDPDAFLRGVPLLDGAGLALYLRSYQLFTEYVTGINNAKEMEAYQNQLEGVRASERGYLFLRAACAVKNHFQYGFSVSRRFGLYHDSRPAQYQKIRIQGTAHPEVPLTYLYDEKGLPHTWVGSSNTEKNVYVYSSPADSRGPGPGEKGGPVKLTRRGIVGALAESFGSGAKHGPTHGREILDVECGICGIRLSEIHTLDVATASKSLQVLSEFASFFSFYDTRCPVKNLHEFPSAGEPCGKCGIYETLISGYGQAEHASEARAYYDKYTEHYRRERDIVTSVGVVTPASHSMFDPETEALQKYGGFAAEWVYDCDLLIRAAELIDTRVAALESIGATERRLYPDVLSGVGVPPPPTTTGDPRLLAADSDVRVFVTAYNQLRYVHRSTKVGVDTETILGEAQVQSSEYESLIDLFPDISDGYYLKRIAVLHRRSPADVLLFTIESLARMTLAAASIGKTSAPRGKEWLPRLGRIFAQHTLRRIVRGEKLLAKNGPFNFKIFGDDDGEDVEGAGDFDAAEFGVSGEDVLEQIGTDAHDEFSLEGVDIDGANPNLEVN